MKPKYNQELVEKLKGLHERLRSVGVSEDSYHLLGLFGSTNDDDKISLDIKRGKHTISFETYFKERGEKQTVMEFSDIDEACDYIFRKAVETEKFKKD